MVINMWLRHKFKLRLDVHNKSRWIINRTHSFPRVNLRPRYTFNQVKPNLTGIIYNFIFQGIVQLIPSFVMILIYNDYKFNVGRAYSSYVIRFMFSFTSSGIFIDNGIISYGINIVVKTSFLSLNGFLLLDCKVRL